MTDSKDAHVLKNQPNGLENLPLDERAKSGDDGLREDYDLCKRCGRPIMLRAVIRDGERYCSNRCGIKDTGLKEIIYYNGAKLVY